MHAFLYFPRDYFQDSEFVFPNLDRMIIWSVPSTSGLVKKVLVWLLWLKHLALQNHYQFRFFFNLIY